jgi:hypothetical protein
MVWEVGNSGNSQSNGNARGIINATIQGGELVLSYNDGTTQAVGTVAGQPGADGSNGLDGRGIVDGAITPDGQLWLSFTDGSTQNLGQVVGASGQDGEHGVGIVDIRHENDDLVIELSNGELHNFGNLQGPAGAPGRHVSNFEINGGNLLVTFSDGVEDNLGQVVGPAGQNGVDGVDGTSIQQTEIIAGNLVVYYSDGSSENVGKVTGDAGSDGRGIESVEIIDGELVTTYSNGQTQNAGQVQGEAGRGIQALDIVAGDLLTTYTDGSQENHGRVVGFDGSTWYNGSNTPDNSLGADDDLYLQHNGDVYRKNVGNWELIQSLVGPSGQDGETPTLTDNGDGSYTVSTSSQSITISDGAQGPEGQAPTLTDNGDGSYTISTSSQSITIYDGAQGDTGADGETPSLTDNGDGTHTVATSTQSITISDGAQGDAGADGETPTLTDNGDGTHTVSTSTQSITISDGSPGINWRDVYDPDAIYNKKDGVFFGGSSWRSTVDNNQGVTPNKQNAEWVLIAEGGAIPEVGIKPGFIFSWGGPIAPPGTIELEPGARKAVSRVEYAGLYAEIGDTWGAGDGSTTFNLPEGDLFLVGKGPGRVVGDIIGQDSHNLAHTHSVTLASGAAAFAGSQGVADGTYQTDSQLGIIDNRPRATTVMLVILAKPAEFGTFLGASGGGVDQALLDQINDNEQRSLANEQALGELGTGTIVLRDYNGTAEEDGHVQVALDTPTEIITNASLGNTDQLGDITQNGSLAIFNERAKAGYRWHLQTKGN